MILKLWTKSPVRPELPCPGRGGSNMGKEPVRTELPSPGSVAWSNYLQRTIAVRAEVLILFLLLVNQQVTSCSLGGASVGRVSRCVKSIYAKFAGNMFVLLKAGSQLVLCACR